MDHWLQRTSENMRWMKLPLSVLVLLLIIGFVVFTPEGLLGKADAIGYAVCHRIDLRSYHIGERPLPLCTRCTGMYLGAMLVSFFSTALAIDAAPRLPDPFLPYLSSWHSLSLWMA